MSLLQSAEALLMQERPGTDASLEVDANRWARSIVDALREY